MSNTPQKSRALIKREVHTAELSSGQLIFAICVALVVALVCFLTGVLVGEYQNSLRTQQAKVTAPPPRLTDAKTSNPDPRDAPAVGAPNQAGTALASTFLISTLVAPAPAAAQTACTQPASPLPIIDLNVDDAIVCVNTEARTNAAGDAISLSTTDDDGHYIDLYSNGLLTASEDGIDTLTSGDNSFIAIENVGDIDADINGIVARTYGDAITFLCKAAT